MFGHQDEKPNSNDAGTASTATAPVVNNQMGSDSLPTIAADPVVDDLAVEHGSALANPDKQVLSPAGGYPKASSQNIRPGGISEEVIEEKLPEVPSPMPPANPQSDLAGIKSQVISELFPLIGELDQTPDERFKTLMMMIQATDNQELIRSAYEAAHNIDEPKKKAQALLDIINEINYFTQHA
ncbi:MAG TPA: hypothetical protein VLF63_01405 [Patescibacteria group bacterium]|nr:hypothetical protein [Patescibacteria group bacterium]